MVIYKRISAWNQLDSFASDEWDKVGDLVKHCIDNNCEDRLDVIATEEFPNGCDEDEFHDWVCNEAEDIIKKL